MHCRALQVGQNGYKTSGEAESKEVSSFRAPVNGVTFRRGAHDAVPMRRRLPSDI